MATAASTSPGTLAERFTPESTPSRMGRKFARAMLGQRAGLIELEEIEINPSPVQPGGTIQVSVTIAERAEFVGPLDPDLCDPPSPGPGTGLRAEVTVSPQWTGSRSKSACVPVRTILSPGRRTLDFEFSAPTLPEDVSSQSFVIDSRVRLPGSEQESRSVQRTIVAQQGALREEPSDQNGDQASTGTFRPFLCLFNPLRACNFREQVGMAGTFGFLILVLALAVL